LNNLSGSKEQNSPYSRSSRGLGGGCFAALFVLAVFWLSVAVGIALLYHWLATI
jgi:hypothetical protein